MVIEWVDGCRVFIHLSSEYSASIRREWMSSILTRGADHIAHAVGISHG